MEQNITNNIKAKNQNIEVLKKHFGQCFDKGGNFDFEKFKQELSENEIDFYKESYGIDWLGKSYARVLASDPTTTLLKEDEEFNAREENKDSENLLIKGDNLEVLKHLTNAYYEKVKMIYIDPPYNTGKDGFVYEDDRKITAAQLKDLAGIDEKKASRIIEFTKSKSNSHSAWLTFMYPRLYVAKQLLKEDGVIFISIDDNELSQLKILLDDIFGDENFLGNLILQTATDNNPTQINTEHEYILCYARQKEKLDKWFNKSKNAEKIIVEYERLKDVHADDVEKIQTELRKWIKKNKSQLAKVTHYDNVDSRGVFHDGDIANTRFGGYKYDVLHPVTQKPCKIPDKGFRYPESTMKEMISNDEIIFGDDENTLIKPKKRIENVKDILRTMIYEDGRASTKVVEELLSKSVFDNPKSHFILSRLIGFISKEDDIILDFFAGSGTTGHATMQLNAEQEKNRKYILVQLPELINEKKNKEAFSFVKNELKVAVPTIFHITKERLVRASKKINLEYSGSKKIDFGLKIFETNSIWEDYGFDSKELSDQTKLFDETKLNEEDLKALLITWKTFDGSPLTEQATTYDFEGYTGYYVNSKLYLMDKGFSTSNLTKLLEKIDSDKNFNPTSVIAFGYHFDSKNLREISENIKSYANKKNIDIDFITRY